jgi:hypothetical protein
MKRILFSLSFLIAASLVGNAQTRYISVSGTDASNNCIDALNPCATISHAVTEALPGDSILVASGTYSFFGSQVIDKRVILAGADSLNKPVITAIASDIIQVTADSVTIRDLRIEMGLTILNGSKGIVASGSYN